MSNSAGVNVKAAISMIKQTERHTDSGLLKFSEFGEPHHSNANTDGGGTGQDCGTDLIDGDCHRFGVVDATIEFFLYRAIKEQAVIDSRSIGDDGDICL